MVLSVGALCWWWAWQQDEGVNSVGVPSTRWKVEAMCVWVVVVLLVLLALVPPVAMVITLSVCWHGCWLGGGTSVAACLWSSPFCMNHTCPLERQQQTPFDFPDWIAGDGASI